MRNQLSALFALVILILVGCSAAEKKTTPEKHADYPAARYLTAEGSGETEMEARRQALAALSGIFESKVHAETTSFARAAMGPDTDELFEKNVESKIEIVSSVQLTGAQIGRVWHDAAAPGAYHALAVVDRAKTGRIWADELETVTAKTAAQVKNLAHITGRFQRMLALNRIIVGVLRKQALESRLRVLNYPARSALDVDITQITADLARLRSQLRFYINFSGDGGQAVADRLAEAFTANGLVIVKDRNEADALIGGHIEIHPLSLNNPRAQFVRAAATVKIMETDTGSVVATFNESVRKGHVDQAEAVRNAVAALAETLAEKLITEIGFGGDDATD
jgi:hypothetical protein